MLFTIVIILAANLLGFDARETWLAAGAAGLVLLVYNSLIVHFKKPYYSRTTAVWLSVWLPGLGQFYLRQLKLGTVFFLLYPAAVVYVMEQGLPVADRFLILAVITFISALFAYMSKVRPRRSAADAGLEKQAVEKYRALLPHLKKGIAPALDTNILMHEPLLLVSLLRDSNAPILVSKQVFNELDGLKKSDKQDVKKRAQLAFDLLEEFQNGKRLGMIEIPNHQNREKLGAGHSGDDKIAASYLQEMAQNKTALAFLTNDKGARILARDAALPVFELDGTPPKAVIIGNVHAASGTFKTGLAVRRRLFDWKTFKFPSVHLPRFGGLVRIGVAILAISWLYNYLEGEQVAKGDEPEVQSVWEAPAFPFEELEVTDVSVKSGSDYYRIEYEVINHSDSAIVFGYVPQDDSKRNPFGFNSYPDAIKTVYHDGSEKKEAGGPEIDPKEKETIIFYGSEPLENLKAVSAKIQHAGTGEVAEWKMEDK